MHKIRIDTSKLGEALKEARLFWDMTYTQWGALADMSAQHCYLMEQGRVIRPTLESVLKMAYAIADMEAPSLNDEELLEHTLHITCNLLRKCVSLERKQLTRNEVSNEQNAGQS